MKIRMREHEEGLVELVIDGNIMQENVDILKNRLHDLIDNNRIQMILNLESTSYISSLCIAVIINVKNRLSALNGDIKIVVISKLIYDLFEITNLTKKLGIYKTSEEACMSFCKSAVK